MDIDPFSTQYFTPIDDVPLCSLKTGVPSPQISGVPSPQISGVPSPQISTSFTSYSLPNQCSSSQLSLSSPTSAENSTHLPKFPIRTKTHIDNTRPYHSRNEQSFNHSFIISKRLVLLPNQTSPCELSLPEGIYLKEYETSQSKNLPLLSIHPLPRLLLQLETKPLMF